MAIDPEITRNVEQVRNATYGKDVREAIARGLELCYGYTSGETADEAAQRANAAAASVEGLIDASQAAVTAVQGALSDLDHIVEVSTETPTASTNKIWIQPQDNTEYKVATYDAYDMLWNRMNDFEAEYGNGHGGIESIVLDSQYTDPNDELKKRYIITYSDQTTGEFFVEDGPQGPQGPIDTIASTKIWFKKITSQNFTPTPPAMPYSDTLPSLDPGDYLWTITEITYESEAKAYLYGFTRMGLNGLDGSGAVNAVALGDDGEALPNTAGTVHIPLDQEPNAGSGALLTSDSVYNALQDLAPLSSPALTGIPTAPTPSDEDNSTRIATTEFVKSVAASGASAARCLDVTMSGKTLEILDEGITADTYCLFAGVYAGDFFGALNWTTIEGKLTLSTSVAPSSSKTFFVILFDFERAE